MNIKNYSYQIDEHRAKKVILIKFKYDRNLVAALRTRFPSAKWSKTKASWYLPDLPSIRRALSIEQESPIDRSLLKIDPVNRPAFVLMNEQLQLKQYSDNTVRIYLGEFLHLLKLLRAFPVDELTPKRLKDYFLFCLNKERIKRLRFVSYLNNSPTFFCYIIFLVMSNYPHSKHIVK